MAVTWSLLALEASLYVCLNARDRQDLGKLLRKAKQAGLITADEFTALENVRELRNTVVHGGLRPTFPPAAAVEMLDLMHETVSFVYRRTADTRS